MRTKKKVNEKYVDEEKRGGKKTSRNTRRHTRNGKNSWMRRAPPARPPQKVLSAPARKRPPPRGLFTAIDLTNLADADNTLLTQNRPIAGH